MLRAPALVAVGFISMFATTSAGHAQTLKDLYPELTTVVGSGGSAFDWFGGSVAVSGNTLVVGAPYDFIDGTTNDGTAHVFMRKGDVWIPEVILAATDAGLGQLFGYSLSLSGDTLAVGSPGHMIGTNANQGSVRIFTRESGVWTQRATITPPDGDAGDFFGWDVALSGDRLAVGARYDDVSGRADQGSVRMYELVGSTWTLRQTVTAADGAANDQFGVDVALEGDTLVVGASRDSAPLSFQGSVRVFTRVGGSWLPQQTLTASDGASSDLFGEAVAISGNTIAVGAPSDQIGPSGAQGSVRVFTRSGAVWSEQAMLTASDGAAEDRLGWRVALLGDLILASSISDRVGNNEGQGSVRVFTRSGGVWSGQTTLVALDGATGDAFGHALALSNDTIAVGVAEDDVDGRIDQGSVHMFGNYRAWNQTRGIGATTLASAVDSSVAGDRLLVGSLAFSQADGIVDASQKRLRFTALEPLALSSTALMSVASETVFETSPAVASGGLTVNGRLVAPIGGTVTFQQLTVGSLGQLSQRGSNLLLNQNLATTAGGIAYLQGPVLAQTVSTAVGGQNRCAGDTEVFANYNNAGSTIVQRGILYIYGTLTNTGTITGEVDNGFLPPNPGDGYSIGGDYVVSAASSIVLPDPVWWLRVGGNFDVAINSAARFVMDKATLELTGLGPKGAQSVEVLSRDLGAVNEGFATTNFPLGALRVRAGATVSLADNRNNAPGKTAEAVYTQQLVVPAGSTLVTSGYRIYTRVATVAGSVSNPSDIVVVPATPPCPADLFPNGVVDAADLGILLSTWGPCSGSCVADLNGDGQVGASDLAAVLAGWGPCSNDS